ncbi:MAG: hypothetical protein EXS50_00065 [Candidatus Taylorbacteria bacterium]|nr:hypothetical protein [Candidatus Taylorbacteria bacterium]
MNLLEHQGKALLSKYGIKIPQGIILTNPKQKCDLSFPLVIKIQMPFGDRKKLGGIENNDIVLS